jgi:LPS export ABC transporter protein LptC
MNRDAVKQPKPAAVARSLLTVAVTCLLVGFAGGCGTGDETVSERSAGPHPEQQFYDYRLIESKDGVKQWLLESDTMQKFAGEQEVHLVTVRMKFYRDGAFFSTLIADSGRANLTTKNLFAWGNVEVTTHDGRRLETSELHYDNERGIIHNDVFDRMTQGEDVVTGIGLEATPDLDYIEIRQRVQGEVGDDTAAGSER